MRCESTFCCIVGVLLTVAGVLSLACLAAMASFGLFALLAGLWFAVWTAIGIGLLVRARRLRVNA